MDNSRVRNIKQWAVGITTAPRKRSTLAQTLNSLKSAGWDDPRLFVEPETEIPSEFDHLPVSLRDKTLGAFPNWYLALTEMVLRDPRAEAFLLCQDDVLFASDIRDYLELNLWPAQEVGVVSIYCPSHYPQSVTPGFKREDRGWKSWGALAYIFSNPSARAILSDSMVLNHRDFGPAEGLHHIDSVVGYWCERNQLPYFVHSPSLAQHIGDSSTIYPKATVSGNRQAKDFHIQFKNTIFDGQTLPDKTTAQQLSERKISQFRNDNLPDSDLVDFHINPVQPNNKIQSLEPSYDIDVFVPYFRNLDLVPQTVDSILWQSGIKPLIHLVNDCSKEDDSILKRKYADTPNIRWYRTRENCGPYKIANGLFYFMASQTIAIVDSDDILLPEHLRKSLDALEENKADIYGSSMRQFLNPLEKHSERSIKMLEDIPTLISGTLPSRLKYPLVINGTMVIRKQAFEAVNGYDGRMVCGADIEFIQRIQYPSNARAKIHTSNEVTALRRICSNSLSNHDSEFGYKSQVREANAKESFRRYNLWQSQQRINPREFGTLDQCKEVLVPVINRSLSESKTDNLGRLRKNQTITACLASIPTRETALSKTVESLIDQVDELKVYLNGYPSAPLFLNHPKIEVVMGDNSRGDNSKFHWIDSLHGYVFTCDDDLLYPPDYIQEMQRGIDNYRCLVGASGSSLKASGTLSSFLKGIDLHPLQREIHKDTNADIVGTGTLGYHTEDLRLKFSDFVDFNMADLSLFRVARREKIPRKVIRHPNRWITRSTKDHGIYENNLNDDSLETTKVNDILRAYPENRYSGKRITVVLINYKRTKNTHRIIDSLRRQTISPIIYVWNNGNEPFENPDVDWVINSNQNVHGHPLHFLYQYASTEFICRMDDDLIPADNFVFEDVIDFMLDYGRSQRIVGGYGVILKDGKNYQESTQVGCGPHYKPIESNTPIDIVKGRIMWFRQEFASEIPMEKSHVHVDLTTSFGLSKGRRQFHIIPHFLEGRLHELEDRYDNGGEGGYSRRNDHYESRNQLTQSWIHKC